MSKFLIIPPLNIGKSSKWILDGLLIYQSTLLNKEIQITAGFETDLASIPRLSRWLIPVNGKHRAAAIVHDYIYSRGGRMNWGIITRKRADKVFREAMEILKVKSWRIKAMYYSVRLFGWNAWGK